MQASFGSGPAFHLDVCSFHYNLTGGDSELVCQLFPQKNKRTVKVIYQVKFDYFYIFMVTAEDQYTTSLSIFLKKDVLVMFFLLLLFWLTFCKALYV